MRINPGYPLAQLLKALTCSGDRAPERAEQWRQVLEGLCDATLRVGPRTPVEGIPSWVTLEVTHGGFATGNLAADGPLQPHEAERMHSLPQLSGGTDRTTLNLFFLSDNGRPELAAMLADGRFRIQVPEEGALLILTWLLERGEAVRAAGLLEAILPLFDRLRFYPVPHPRPARLGIGVYVWTVRESVRALRATRPQVQVARMNEALRAWTPLEDRAVALFLETVVGELPFLRTTESGELERGPGGQPLVAGGWPCRRYPDGWTDRARRIDAVGPWVGSDLAARAAARATLTQAVTLAVEAFPQTILPNKLVKELQALAAGAGLALPLVEELAADIFMGAFAEKFLRAAQIAALLLQGSLYARYYSIPIDALLGMDDVDRQRHATAISPEFARLCVERAGQRRQMVRGT
jgi:hypothetical protein